MWACPIKARCQQILFDVLVTLESLSNTHVKSGSNSIYEHVLIDFETLWERQAERDVGPRSKTRNTCNIPVKYCESSAPLNMLSDGL